MKTRPKRIDVEGDLKVATRQIADTVDADGMPLTWITESYLPAHVWVIELANGSQLRFHHDSGPQLLAILATPDDTDDGEDSDAVLIKLNNYKADNVSYEATIREGALQRVLAAVRAGTLAARKNDDNLLIR